MTRHKWIPATADNTRRRFAVCGLRETYRRRAMRDEYGVVYRTRDGAEIVNPKRVPPCKVKR